MSEAWSYENSNGEKQCKSCEEWKLISLFVKDRNTLSGYGSRCKECVNAQKRMKRKMFTRKDKDKEALAQRVYLENNREKVRERKRTREAASGYAVKPYTHKVAAGVTLRRNVRMGRIVKPEKCESCGSKERLHGHHSDYSKPLSVEWLCSICHGKRHRVIIQNG